MASEEIARDLADADTTATSLRQELLDRHDEFWRIVKPELDDYQAARESESLLEAWREGKHEPPLEPRLLAAEARAATLAAVSLVGAIAVAGVAYFTDLSTTVAFALIAPLIFVWIAMSVTALGIRREEKSRSANHPPEPDSPSPVAEATPVVDWESTAYDAPPSSIGPPSPFDGLGASWAWRQEMQGDPALDIRANRATREERYRREQPRRRLQLESSLATLRQALLERTVMPALRARLSELVEAPYDQDLPVVEAPGLAQLGDPAAEITPAVRDRVREVVGPLTSGTVGIAGPRGAGKTTLLRALREGRLNTDGTGFGVTCFVAAPVRYDTREFLLHLIRELCEGVGPAARPPDVHTFDSELRTAIREVSAYLLAWTSVGAAVALLTMRFQATPFAVGVGCAVAGAGIVLGILLLPSTGPAMDASERAIVVAFAVFAAVPGAILAWDGYDGRVEVSTYASGLVLVGGLLLSTWIGRAAILRWLTESTTRSTERIEPFSSQDETARLASERSLREEAARLLETTRYQLSFSKSVSSQVSLDLKAIGLQMSTSDERSMERLPLTMPEIVRMFTDFAARVGSTQRILICIDELDKMASVEEVEGFLNDVKAVFDITNCCFLVSVSEDALATFERRGLRQRTAIDSTFDDIVRVDYLDWPSALALLNRRVVGVPPMFWALCHALAGGLARDLVRTSRVLFRTRLTCGDSQLGSLTPKVVGVDLQDRAAGTLQAFRALGVDEVPDEAVRWVDDLYEVGVHATRSPAIDSLLDFLAPEVLDGVIRSKDDGTQFQATMLVQQLAAQVLFLDTVQQVFGNLSGRGQIDRLRRGDDRPLVDLLAEARRDAMHGPAASWSTTCRFRGEWRLPSVDRPW